MVKLTLGCVMMVMATLAQASGPLTCWNLLDTSGESPFKQQIVAEIGRWVVSNPTVVAMPADEAALTVRNGEVSINDDEFSAAPRIIRRSDRLRLRLVTNSAWHELSTATLVVGDATAKFSVLLADASPDPFTFTAQTDVARSTNIESNVVTVTGIDEATPISITGGFYRIDGGAWTQAAGTINVNQTLQVYVMSSSSYNTTTTATVTVGDYSTGFSVTTTDYSSGGGGYGGGGDGGGGGYGSGSFGSMILVVLGALVWWRRRLM